LEDELKTGKMAKRRWKLLIFGLTMISFLIFGSILFAISMEKNPEPKNFVESLKFEQQEGFLFIREIVRYPTKGNVTPLLRTNKTIKVGVTTQTDELNFGVVPENLTVRKFINLRNNDKIAVKICVLSYGSIKPFIIVRDNDFLLKENDAKEVEIAFNATKIGSYRGEIDVVIRKPKYEALEKFLGLVKC
jgi:hypothetical protein